MSTDPNQPDDATPPPVDAKLLRQIAAVERGSFWSSSASTALGVLCGLTIWSVVAAHLERAPLTAAHMRDVAPCATSLLSAAQTDSTRILTARDLAWAREHCSSPIASPDDLGAQHSALFVAKAAN